jgi:hydrogenase nickel incorporation protein HypB
MCAVCGCSGHVPDAEGATGAIEHHHAHDHAHDGHHHHHGHEHHHHDHAHPHVHHDATDRQSHAARLVRVERDLLARNDEEARANRRWLDARGLVAINLVSAPGAGKTALVERMLRDGRAGAPIAVIEGDQATDRDAARIRAAGGEAVQINTGTGCHLDAAMVRRALAELGPREGALVIIENVGNLVCPALFALGEHATVALVSVTEGDDKPLKYPHIFQRSTALVTSKLDLLPHVDFSIARCREAARSVNPALELFALSAKSGEGLDGWYDFVRETARRAHGSRPALEVAP